MYKIGMQQPQVLRLDRYGYGVRLVYMILAFGNASSLCMGGLNQFFNFH
jgi:hypothetical protein